MKADIKEFAKMLLEFLLEELEKQNIPKEEHDRIQESLLPCPHCGSTAVETDNNKPAVFFGGGPLIPGYHKIQCYRCNASVEQSSVEAAVKVWNSRS